MIVSWTQSHVGPAVSFEVWRSVGTTISAAKTLIGITSAPTTTLSDDTVKPKATYTYVVVGIQADGTEGYRIPDNHDQVAAAVQPDGLRHLTRPARLRISGNRGSSPALSRIVRYTRYESTKPVLFSSSRKRPL